MSQTELMASILVFQFIVSFLGQHFALAPTIDYANAQILGQAVENLSIWEIAWRAAWNAVTSVIDTLASSVPAGEILKGMVEFSLKMMTFQIQGMNPVFNVIWLAMTFIVGWCIVSLIRGTND